MGRSGPPAKPRAIREAEGGRTVSHRPLKPHEPLPEKLTEVPVPPPGLGAIAQRIWISKAHELHRLGVLTVVDLDEFKTYCILHEELNELRALKRAWQRDPELRRGVWRLHARIDGKAALLRQYAAEYGMMPAPRVRIEAPRRDDPEHVDPHDELALRRAARTQTAP